MLKTKLLEVDVASFTVRVELHEATEEDYDTLHRFMEQRGFKRTITGQDGHIYQLPPAEYVILNVAQNKSEVRDRAAAAAHLTGKRNAVFVTEVGGGGWAWSGLEPVS